MKMETEIKIRLREGELEAVQSRLSQTGCEPVSPRQWEENLIFDLPGRKLLETDCLLRLRTVGTRHLLTFKGPQQPHSILKQRPEAEVEVNDPSEARKILEALGYEVHCRYDKYREKWVTKADRQELKVCLDETPFGSFVEIEGDPGAVRDLAEGLDLDLENAVTKSYLELYLEAGLGQI